MSLIMLDKQTGNFQRYSKTGIAQGDLIRAHNTQESQQNSAVAASLLGGDFVIVWRSFGQDGSHGGIYAQQFEADGETIRNSIPLLSQ